METTGAVRRNVADGKDRSGKELNRGSWKASRLWAEPALRVISQLFRHKHRDIAILAVGAALAFELRTRCTPDRRGRTLRNGLQVLRGIDHRPALLVHEACRLECRRVVGSRQVRPDDRAGMDGEGAHAVRLPSRVQRDREQDVGRFRSPVDQKRIVGATLEVGIVEYDRREDVTSRTQRRHTGAPRLEQARPERGGQLEFRPAATAPSGPIPAT